MKRSYIEEHEMVSLIISAMERYYRSYGKDILDGHVLFCVRTFIYDHQCKFQLEEEFLRVFHGSCYQFTLRINDNAFPDGSYWCVPRKLSQESRDKIEQARDALIL